ncbi:MAG: hypothetical protein EBV49_11015 [Betaproteobacteria bacterium]|nr:hypothetical protein [Betaproteobacteria bacterium]
MYLYFYIDKIETMANLTTYLAEYVGAFFFILAIFCSGGNPLIIGGALAIAIFFIGFASALNDQQIRDVSAYFAAQKLKPAAAKNKDLVELGQKIYRGGIADKGVPACAGCHSPNGAGIPDQYPRLQGQYAEYTESQLVAFRQGTRANSTQMMTIAARMSDKEMKAVSDYIAGLR